jgi:hypothetical protein
MIRKNKENKKNNSVYTTVVRTFAQDVSIDLLQSSTDQSGFDQFLGRRGG